MSRKSKGISAERELVHILQDNGFSAIRVAGSGCTVAPSADILAGNGIRLFSFECKTIKGTSRYITKEAVADFLSFSRKFGAEPWIAVRFFREPWKFLLCEDMGETEKNFAVTQQLAENKGLSLQELLK